MANRPSTWMSCSQVQVSAIIESTKVRSLGRSWQSFSRVMELSLLRRRQCKSTQLSIVQGRRSRSLQKRRRRKAESWSAKLALKCPHQRSSKALPRGTSKRRRGSWSRASLITKRPWKARWRWMPTHRRSITKRSTKWTLWNSMFRISLMLAIICATMMAESRPRRRKTSEVPFRHKSFPTSETSLKPKKKMLETLPRLDRTDCRRRKAPSGKTS